MTSNYEYDLFKLIGIIIFVCFLAYICVKSLTLQTSIIEGLTNGGDDRDGDGVSDGAGENFGSGAATFSTKISARMAQLKDRLNIDKYRKDYENVIIHLDEYISGIMLGDVLSLSSNNISKDEIVKVMERMNVLKQGKDSLNVLMAGIDKMD
jgi:hypothetical protein